MLSTCVIVCLLGLTVSQSQSDLFHEHIDIGFHVMDVSPKDGHVTEAEFTAQTEYVDVSNDGCVTSSEYYSTHPDLLGGLASRIFRFMDADSNDCLTTSELQMGFHKLDLDDDNLLSLQEYDKFMMRMVSSLIIG